MRVLSLFSGIGLIDLGLSWAGFTTAGLCEIDLYGQAVLRKHWPSVPIWGDVREVTGAEVATRCGEIDIIAGGFPCQPHSVAGKRKGKEDERHLWPEFARVVREVRPRWVLAENVPGLRTTAADEVLADLDAAGYACWPLVVGADDVGAPHRRKRVWIVARLRLADGDSERERDADELRRQQWARWTGAADAGWSSKPVGDTQGRGQYGSANDPQGSGQGRNDPARSGERSHPRKPVGEPTGAGLEGQRTDAGQPQVTEHRHPGDPTLLRGWPARPGEQQHGWEAPRLADTGRGRDGGRGCQEQTGRPEPSSGSARQPQPGMGGESGGSPRRLAGWLRRAQLKALGNGVVPQVVAEVGRAILAFDYLHAAPAEKAKGIMNRTKPRDFAAILKRGRHHA